jgi:hypothetical protein
MQNILNSKQCGSRNGHIEESIKVVFGKAPEAASRLTGELC